MREIKFRQWNSHYQRMRYGIGASRGCWTGFESVNWDKSPAMQYTGLKDKNGKEIYEADILLMQLENTAVCGIVEYVSTGFMISTASDFWPIDDYESIQVIGNIYGNPELKP